MSCNFKVVCFQSSFAVLASVTIFVKMNDRKKEKGMIFMFFNILRNFLYNLTLHKTLAVLKLVPFQSDLQALNFFFFVSTVNIVY